MRQEETGLGWRAGRGDRYAPGQLFSETNDDSEAILLTYGTAYVLLADDAEAREEEYMASAPTRDLKRYQSLRAQNILSCGSAPA
jgi:hypothetical protein